MYQTRQVAGQALSKALGKYKKAPKTIVIGLPRGGVVVAAEVAKALNLPLDIIVPRKIGAPHNEEFGIGALVEDLVWIDQETASIVGASKNYIDQIVAKEKKEAKRRLSLYRAGKPPPHFLGWTAILVDDGIATGATMRVSIAWLKQMGTSHIVVAVPVAPPEILAELQKEVDEFVCLLSPEDFAAVGGFYENFPQVEDSEVISLLKYSAAAG